MSAHAIAGLGHNSPPPDLDFMDVRIVYDAIAYVQFRFNTDRVMAKKAGRRKLGLRKLVAACLKGIVSRDNMARIMNLDSKLLGEDWQRAEVWGEEDDEFAEQFEHLRQAVVGHISINVDLLVEKLDRFIRTDPERRRLEELARAHQAAARQAEIAAADLKARAKASQRANDLRAALRSAPHAETVIAQHKGAREMARDMSDAAINGALEIAALLAIKGKTPRRALASELNAAGLAECIGAGVLHDAEPSLSLATDRQIGVTKFGVRVFEEAIGRRRIVLKKRSKEQVSVDEEDDD